MPQTVDEFNARVFSAVFPDAPRPPRNIAQYESDTEAITTHVTEQLRKVSVFVLGLRDEEYVLTNKKRETGFKPHFSSCPSLQAIHTPSNRARLALIGAMVEQVSHFPVREEWLLKLGNAKVKTTFAGVINQIMNEYVHWAYAGTYNDEVRSHLRFWVEHLLMPWIATVLHVFDHAGHSIAAAAVPVSNTAKLAKYQSMAYSKLWSMRVDELFDIVVEWDDAIAGIDNIKPLLTTAQSRQYVSQKFATALQKRLLHPGASTIEILQVYISTIRAFKRLDPRGVLLSKVSGRVRQYLRERDDTVKVVVAGLLADADPVIEQKSADKSVDVMSELAWELQHRDAHASKNAYNMDWNNMEWQPEPIDAVPEQAKNAKHMDVIGSIISLFESKEVFVKELQITLAERLLRNKTAYDHETAVIEHLKIRFGDAALQACEVMLKDVLDSRRLDQIIREDQGLAQQDEGGEKQEPELHAKILSRLFWPALPGAPTFGDDSSDQERFKPPISILHQRNLYEQGFESLKQTRKVAWNDNLGQVEIELEFADRTYHDIVLPYQAGVIYAFHNDEDSSPITKSVSDLSAELFLPAILVRSACLLFVSKRVLQPSTHIHDAFEVLEYLPPEPGVQTAALDPNTDTTTAPTHHNADVASTSASAAAAQAAADRAAELAAQQAAKEAEQKEKAAKMAVYQQFITAMLTNQGAMPLPRIAMMLGMVVPGGFPFSNEELREFLGVMMKDGVVTMQGANYKKA